MGDRLTQLQDAVDQVIELPLAASTSDLLLTSTTAGTAVRRMLAFCPAAARP